MAARGDEDGSTERGRPVAGIAGGVGTAVLLFVLLVVPVVVTLVVPPTPVTLSVPTAIAVFTAIGFVIGVVLQVARFRPLYAGSIAVVFVLIALWLQRGTWLPAPFLPVPPNLPHVPATVTLVTGVFIAATLVAMAAAEPARDGAAGTSSAVSAGVGALGAVAIILATEADVWGLGVYQRTLQGPFGMGRFAWLAVVFFAGLVAAALVGWAATSQRYRPLAPVVGTVVIAACVVVSLGRITGPPRTTLYGLTLGLLIAATIAAVGRSRDRRSSRADAA